PGPVAGVAFAVVVAGGAGDAEVEIGPGVVLDGLNPAGLGRRRRFDDRGLAQTGRADHLGDVLRLFFQQVREVGRQGALVDAHVETVGKAVAHEAVQGPQTL